MRLGAVAVAFALAGLPVATAEWFAKGTWEPDTAEDAADGWMFTSPDTSPDQGVRRVYFNGFLGEYSGTFSPNVASLHTATFHGNRYSFYAMLGVWKDCNRDGYVGIGEDGQWEYRAELLGALADADVCPPQETPIDPQTGKPPMGWFPSHNDGEWVREWLPVSWVAWNAPSTGEASPWDVNDNASRVWADFGDVAQDQPPWGNCWIDPHPRGTYHSTGGLLEHVDCFGGGKVTDSWNVLVAGVGGDDLGLGQLSFSDHPRDQRNSASVLNQRNPWGVQGDPSYAEPWDCGQDQVVVRVEPQTVGGVDGVVNDQRTPWVNVTNASMPNPSPSPNPGGSPAGTANATLSGLDECERSQAPGHRGSAADDPYLLEGDVLNGGVKVQPTATLAPNFATRPAAPYAAVLGKATPPGTDFGTRLTSNDGFWQDATAGHLTEPTVFNDKFDVMFRWTRTYYAFVSPGAVAAYGLTLPKGATQGSYGSDACGASTSGIIDNWQCDATRWWKDADGKDIEPRSTTLAPSPGLTISARPGSAYNLRDVDCYDWSLSPAREAGLDPAGLMGTPCAR